MVPFVPLCLSKGLTVLAGFSKKQSHVKCAVSGDKGPEGPCFMLNQGIYLLFKVNSQLLLLHMLVGKGSIEYTYKRVWVLHKVPPNLEIAHMHHIFPLQILEVMWP